MASLGKRQFGQMAPVIRAFFYLTVPFDQSAVFCDLTTGADDNWVSTLSAIHLLISTIKCGAIDPGRNDEGLGSNVRKDQR